MRKTVHGAGRHDRRGLSLGIATLPPGYRGTNNSAQQKSSCGSDPGHAENIPRATPAPVFLSKRSSSYGAECAQDNRTDDTTCQGAVPASPEGIHGYRWNPKRPILGTEYKLRGTAIQHSAFKATKFGAGQPYPLTILQGLEGHTAGSISLDWTLCLARVPQA